MINRWANTYAGQLLIAITVITLMSLLSLANIGIWIAAPLTLLALPFAITYPYLFSILFFLLCLFRFHELIPGLYNLHLPLFVALVSLFSLMMNIRLGRIKIYWTEEMTYFMMFSIWVTASMLLAYNLDISYGYWHDVYIKIFIAFFLITWTVTTEKAYKALLLLTVLSGVAVSLLTLYYYVTGQHLVEGARATLGGEGVISDPNDLALTLLFPFCFCCSIGVNSSSSALIRLGGFLTGGIITGAIFATQSRGGLIALIAIIAYFVTHKIKSKWSLIVLMFAIIIIFYILLSSVLVRFPSIGSGAIDESGMGRINAWKTAVNMAIHHPVFGVGINGFEDNYFTYAINWDNLQHAAHSSWFVVLAESGFPGLFLFITCVVCAIKTANKNKRYINDNLIQFKQKTIYPILAQGVYSGLIGYCISSTFLTQGFTWPFYIFFALSLALAHSLAQIYNTGTK